MENEPAMTPDDFAAVRQWFDTVVLQWQKAWNPGTYCCADESMIQWVGTGEMHQTVIPRKPTPLGILLKDLACCSSGIVINAEF